MRHRLLCTLLLTILSPVLCAQPSDFSFGVIGQRAKGGTDTANDGAALEQALLESDADNLAFVVAEGFKRADESCSDTLYHQRFTRSECIGVDVVECNG